jgi:CCR4-NOT transcription complex subunit 2
MDKLTWYDREFPSLSNNPQLGNAGQTSMWSTHGRNLGAPLTRNHQPASPSSTQPTQQQDDIFSTSSRLSSAQGSFRFGNQASVGQGPQSQATSVDEFPPLNRNANGDIGQERGTNLMANFGFGSTGAGPSTSGQPSRAGNGLLNALSANSRATDGRSPTAGQ